MNNVNAFLIKNQNGVPPESVLFEIVGKLKGKDSAFLTWGQLR